MYVYNYTCMHYKIKNILWYTFFKSLAEYCLKLKIEIMITISF